MHTATVPAPEVNWRWEHAWVFLGLLVAALVIYWPVLEIRPLRGDNIYLLAWAHHAPLSAVPAGDPAFYPEWRPLAYLTVWLQYRLLELAGMPVYFFSNLALWAACAWLVYRIVDELTHARTAALLAAACLLFDRRAIESLSWIVERQTTLACLFGLTAMLLMTRARDRGLNRSEAAVAAACLLASALSKEYGLAFTGAAAVYAWFRGRRKAGAAATAALVVYAGARLIFAGGAASPSCEEMGFFRSFQAQCIDLRAGAGVPQMAYNMAATVVGTLVPGIFGAEGVIQPEYLRIVRASGYLAIAAVGLRAGGPIVRMLSLLPLINGLLSFMLYRDRNQLIGACAIAIAVGIGMAAWRPLQASPRWHTVRHRAIVAFILILLAIRISDAHLQASAMRDQMTIGLEPCESGVRERPYGDAFVRMVKEHYGMANPACE